MTKLIPHRVYQDYYEYHGNTVIEMTRKKAGVTILRDWLLFDSVEEADAFFNDDCFVPEAV